MGEVYDGEKNMKANTIEASRYLKVEEGLKVLHFSRGKVYMMGQQHTRLDFNSVK